MLLWIGFKMDTKKEYLGDSVYASFDGYQIWLSTLNGNRIAIEPKVWANLLKYRERLIKN